MTFFVDLDELFLTSYELSHKSSATIRGLIDIKLSEIDTNQSNDLIDVLNRW